MATYAEVLISPQPFTTTLFPLKGVVSNSFIKSRTAFHHTNIASIADDTILEVDKLNGEPGLFTARYAGENASYEDNMAKLLQKLDN